MRKKAIFGHEVDAGWYVRTYPDVARAGIDPAIHYRRYGWAEGRLPRQLAALTLETKLRGGFSRSALSDLRRLVGQGDSLERQAAAWVLARWQAGQACWPEALRNLRRLSSPPPPFIDSLDYAILSMEILIRLERFRQADKALKAALRTLGPLPDLCLAAAHLAVAAPGRRPEGRDALGWLNRLFAGAGLAPLGLGDVTRQLTLDNLTAMPPPSQSFEQPLISVLVPAYDVEASIDTALRGLLAQTWRNLEILVIDDASRDRTAERVAALAREDPRITLVRLPENLGAYGARNVGLGLAMGALITTHDGDDWSHPQRLECLAKVLLRQAGLAGVLGHWVRTDTDMNLRLDRTRQHYLHPTVSTLMFRREVLTRLGRWDTVRAGADSEYLERMRAVFGQDCVGVVLPEAPLALARHLPTSLTAAPDTSLDTVWYGYRQVYRALYTRWHARAGVDGLHLELGGKERPFAVPGGFALDNAPVPAFDAVICADFGRDGPWQEAMRAQLESLLCSGQKLALLHWPDYSPPRPMADWALDWCCAGRTDLVVPGQTVETITLFVCASHPFRSFMDKPPRIHFRRACLVPALGGIYPLELLGDAPVFAGRRPLRLGRPTILACAHAAGTQLLGAERSFLDLLTWFQALDCNVLVVLPTAVNLAYVRELHAHCHRVFTVPMEHWSERRPPSAAAVERLSRIINLFDVRAVHSNTTMLREPLLAAHCRGVPGVVHVRESFDNDADLCRSIGLRAPEIRDRVLRAADAVIANSRFTARHFDLPGKTHVVSNSVDLDLLDIPNLLSPDRITIGLISSNIPKKGIFEMVALAKMLQHRTPQAHFILIGPQNEYTALLKAELATGPPLSNLSFRVYTPSSLDAICQVNILLNLSHFEESFGRTVLEAMAARRPVLAYNRGALPELVVDGVNGFLLPYGRLEPLAKKLSWLCKNPGTIASMGEAGREMARRQFSPWHSMEQLRRAYAAILYGEDINLVSQVKSPGERSKTRRPKQKAEPFGNRDGCNSLVGDDG